MTVDFQRAIKEIERVSDARARETELAQTEDQLVSLLVGKQIVGVRHVSGATWAVLLENGLMIDFDRRPRSPVEKSDWRMG